MDKWNQIIRILYNWWHDINVTLEGVGLGILIVILVKITIQLDRRSDSPRLNTIKSLTLVLVTAAYCAVTTGFHKAFGSMVQVIGGWSVPLILVGAIVGIVLMHRYRTMQIITTIAIGVFLIFSWQTDHQPSADVDRPAPTPVEEIIEGDPVDVSGLREQLAKIAGDKPEDKKEDKDDEETEYGFQEGDFDASEIIRMTLIVIVAIFALLRLLMVFMGVRGEDGNRVCKNQWMVTLSPKTRKPVDYKTQFFWPPTILFLLFVSTLMSMLAFPRFMFSFADDSVLLSVILLAIVAISLWAFTKQWRVAVLSASLALLLASISLIFSVSSFASVMILVTWLLGLERLSAVIKLRTAQKLVYEVFGEDTYDPKYYLWAVEKGKGTKYRGPLLKIGSWMRGFRKGIHMGLMSMWWPNAYLQAYIFEEEILEIDTYPTPFYNTSTVSYPDSDEFDGMPLIKDGEDGEKDMIVLPAAEGAAVEAEPVEGEADADAVEAEGPAVSTEVNFSFWKYLDPEPYLPMAEEDRMDEVNFVKRKIINPAVARFTGRLDVTQATVKRLLANTKLKYQMNGRLVTFAEYVAERARPYGWDLRGHEIDDCNQTDEVMASIEELRQERIGIDKAIAKARQDEERAKGTGKALLEALLPLAGALKTDPTLAATMAYKAKLSLFEGPNRIFSTTEGASEQDEFFTRLMAALETIQEKGGGDTSPSAPEESS